MVLEKLKLVRQRIAAAAARSGTSADRIELVAVTKKASLEDVRGLLRSKEIRYMGENRVQDALARQKALGAEASLAQWRFIGHLQTNKVPQALEVFDWIDSVDSWHLAETLDRRLSLGGARRRILIQVKLAERETQSGVAPGDLGGFLDQLRALKRLEPCGLMAIAPMVEPVEAARPHFKLMRRLFERHFGQIRPDGPYLSMGMSRDLEIAVEEGSNMLRVGTALFGK